MRGRDVGKRIALAAVGAAISLAFITLSFFVKFLTISFVVLSAVGVLLPLAKRYYREAILASVVVTVAGFFIVRLSIIPFAAASGFYVVFAVFWKEKGWNRLLGYAVKFAYSCLLFFVLYKVTALLFVDVTKLSFLESLPDAALYIVLNAVFSICFLVYDYLLEIGYAYLKKWVDRIVK